MNLAELEAQIERTEKEIPELGPTLAYYRDLVKELNEVEAGLPRVKLTTTEQEVEITVKGGAPLSVLEPVPVDPHAFSAAFERVLNVFWRHQQGRAEEAAKVARIPWNYDEIVSAFFSEDLSSLLRMAEAQEVDPKLFAYLVMTALRPFFRRYAAGLGKYLKSDWWLDARCPVCGQKGTFGRLAKEGDRRLICPLCDWEWRIARVKCVHCGTEDPAHLAELEVEEVPGYQLHVCNHCKGYLKVADQRGSDRQGIDLFLSDLVTQPLDQVAEERGYTREPEVTQ
ncbi:MAG TPA: formate dehydrogenase accessory protein FdhE [Firmicutes bacterium]|nr:formate dehydrogenase accessory protein FdhE [Bacillota bacterium]